MKLRVKTFLNYPEKILLFYFRRTFWLVNDFTCIFPVSVVQSHHQLKLIIVLIQPLLLRQFVLEVPDRLKQHLIRPENVAVDHLLPLNFPSLMLYLREHCLMIAAPGLKQDNLARILLARAPKSLTDPPGLLKGKQHNSDEAVSS